MCTQCIVYTRKKYRETEGIQDLGEVNTRPLVHGRMSEIEHRVHHDFGALGVMTEKDDHVIRKA